MRPVRARCSTRNRVGAPSGSPALRAGLPKCDESPAETPEQEGLGTRLPAAPGSGIETSLRAWARRSPDRHRPPEAGDACNSVRLDRTALFG